jgi:hypothetical protein
MFLRYRRHRRRTRRFRCCDLRAPQRASGQVFEINLPGRGAHRPVGDFQACSSTSWPPPGRMFCRGAEAFHIAAAADDHQDGQWTWRRGRIGPYLRLASEDDALGLLQISCVSTVTDPAVLASKFNLRPLEHGSASTCYADSSAGGAERPTERSKPREII